MRAEYRPTEAAPGLWIIPSWCEAPPAAAPPAVAVVLEPGLAFGTGDHPTTRLCLAWLSSGGVAPGDEVMDYGCGSGVLAVASLALGASRAAGTDIDPLAVQSAKANAALNGLQRRLRAARCDPSAAAPPPALEPEAEGCAGFLGCGAAAFDVVVANILLGPILDLSERLAWCGGLRRTAAVRPGLSCIRVAPHPRVRRARETRRRRRHRGGAGT